jgi:hypothetical protein
MLPRTIDDFTLVHTFPTSVPATSSQQPVNTCVYVILFVSQQPPILPPQTLSPSIHFPCPSSRRPSSVLFATTSSIHRPPSILSPSTISLSSPFPIIKRKPSGSSRIDPRLTDLYEGNERGNFNVMYQRKFLFHLAMHFTRFVFISNI